MIALALSTAKAQDLLSPYLKPTAFSVEKGGAVKGVAQPQDSTRITARVEVPGRYIVAFNVKNSKLDSFTDDKNTDLIAPPAVGGLALQPIQVDGMIAGRVANSIYFRAPCCPAKGATKVHIKGSVAVLVGKDERDIEKKDVVLKRGIDLEFGTLKLEPPLTLTTGGKGARNTMVIYQGEKPIKSVTLLDADGKELADTFLSTYQSGAATTKTQCRSTIIVTGKAIESCTVRLKYFDSLEEITLPVDLEVGPGL